MQQPPEVALNGSKYVMALNGSKRDNQGRLIIVGFSVFLLIANRLVEQSITHWFKARWRVISNLISRETSITEISLPKLSGWVPCIEQCSIFPPPGPRFDIQMLQRVGSSEYRKV